MAKQSRLCLTLLSLWLAAATALAQGSEPRPAAETSAGAKHGAPACRVGQAAAITEIACELSRALRRPPAGALVAAAPATGAAELRRPDALSSRLAAVVAGAIGNGARSSSTAAGLTRARTLASDAGTLVHLKPRLEAGQLQVVADVYPVPRSFWDRVRDPQPSPVDHAFASRRFDPEIRAFLAPVPLVAANITKASAPEHEPVALACDDVNRDGNLELLLVGRQRIHLGRIRRGRFVALASVAWQALSPVAQSPLREPMGGVAIVPGRYLDIGISDRARALRLAPDLSLLGSSGRRIPWPAGGCSRFQGLALRPELVACAQADPRPSQPAFGKPVDAVGGAKLIGPDGRVRLLQAGRLANQPVVELRDAAGNSTRAENVGAQVAVGDVDGDGQPELLTGASTLDPAKDQLIVQTWLASGQLQHRYRLAVPTGIRALAVCPSESAGRCPIAIATRAAIWIVR